MPKKPDYRHQYFARVIRDQHTGTISLQLLDLNETVDLQGGDEFITVGTVVDLNEATR